MKYSLLIWIGCLYCCLSFAQPGTTVELKKPKKYEDRTLASEKSDSKKWGKLRHLMQNTYSHYNYYFNANNRLNELIDKAKASHQDDYTKLLSFYNYDINSIAQNAEDLDSVIYHCTAGVLLHDLRNDWIDDLYFVLGKAYYYRKNYDSALNAFQFINYAWAPKDDGYDIPIGSSESGNNGVFSIANKEKDDLLHKTVAKQPVRNANFLWLAKANIAMGNSGRAAGLLQILQHDPNFPKRLQASLNENLAYLYYTDKRYDSAAYHLDAALDNAASRFERARWEYLIAQMYAMSGNREQAINYFARSAEHTTDPIMEVNAYLYSITIGNDSTGSLTQQKLDALLKMAKRDKYVMHRDVIYYAAAKVEMQLNDTSAAKALLKKSVTSSVDNGRQKSQSFLLLADLSYDGRKWIESHRYYDSTQASYINDSLALQRYNLRQPVLSQVANYLLTVDKQDSLQRVASLPTDERTAYLRKAWRQIRRSQGLSEDEPTYGSNLNPSLNAQTQAQLFVNPSSSSDWYFNNNSLKTAGFGAFRQQWGNRPNVDNWRRQSAIDQAITMPQQAGGDVDGNASITQPPANSRRGYTPFTPPASQQAAAAPAAPQSIQDLEAGLPLTPQAIGQSNNKKSEAYFKSGLLFQENLRNYPAAIEMYEKMQGFSDSSQYREQALLNLYFCFTKLGDKRGADSALTVLKQKYPTGKSLASLQNKTSKAASERSQVNPATQAYQKVYNLFIEGNFAEAEKQKAAADSAYGKSYWTPQLLYIESIYYVSERKDSVAMQRLLSLETQFSSSPLAAKAATMIDVLKRRSEIENYLTNLKVTRNEDTSLSPIINLNPTETVVNKPAPVKRDSVVTAPPPVAKAPVIKADTAKAVVAAPKTFSYNPADPQYAVLLLDKVAPVFAGEAKNAFNRYDKQVFYNQPQLNANSVKLDDRYNLVLIGPFSDALGALDYIDKVKPVTAGKILPWLTADKFSFLMISQANLDLLNDNKDVEGYRKLIQKALPGKF